MNKQQLAAKIWESANQMRSKIEANEYKDYILGFIFYKYLSEKQVEQAQEKGLDTAQIAALSEDDQATLEYLQEDLGYFIAYDNLFSTWLSKGSDFDIANVRDGLSAFSRLIHPNHKKLFGGIFTTLETGLSKLGENSLRQTRAVSDLLQLIKDIPMDGKQGYDVLGYIYEYLIEKFAANAGKKAGEFYTPHEVSLLMSEIIAYHLKDNTKIDIYDPTSGSGSLLINIGHAVSKYISDKNSIFYYAQELKANTYNLTRMNLIMRGISTKNIFTRNADTLEDDWPMFDENDPAGTYKQLQLDAVVSNPPYSQPWDPSHKDNDPRYKNFGLAPKTKADYAFLLHDLFHLKPHGIMTIVLPHGVLFRGGEEGTIRQQLIENNHIETIIGLPANIFFGTGIPTVIIVLRQTRQANDVLFVDASKHFKKEGKTNKLQASDIKRIVDTVIERQDRPNYAKLVSKQTLQDNDYNLNIPRYVDTSAKTETWDLHATMLGGIPQHEIEQLAHYWQAFPQLRDALFKATDNEYTELATTANSLTQIIQHHPQVQAFIAHYQQAFAGFDGYLHTQLIDQYKQVNLAQQEAVLAQELFDRLHDITLIDKYTAYQHLNDQWQNIVPDIEMLQTEGFAAAKQVDPIMVIKIKKGREEEVQEGWQGHILPFDLVQTTYLTDELNALQTQQDRLVTIAAELEATIDSLTEEEKSTAILNDTNDKFNKAETTKTLKSIYADIETPEINALHDYLQLLKDKAKKAKKQAFISNCSSVNWQRIIASKDGTYSKSNTEKYLLWLQSQETLEPDSFESKIAQVVDWMYEEATLKNSIKAAHEALQLQTKATIESLSDAQAKELLALKWFRPLLEQLTQLPEALINDLSRQVQALADKYATTYADVAQDITISEQNLAAMLDDLTGSEADMAGLSELKKLLLGE